MSFVKVFFQERGKVRIRDWREQDSEGLCVYSRSDELYTMLVRRSMHCKNFLLKADHQCLMMSEY